MGKDQERVAATNKKARHEYYIEKVYEAGLELKGTEVKSIRLGKASLGESYIDVRNGEAYVIGMHVTPYDFGNIQNADPLRKRRLLLHKKEIRQLESGITRDGYTVVPLSLVIRRGLVKLDIALAKGKKLYDKRQTLKEKDDRRRMDRAMKDFS